METPIQESATKTLASNTVLLENTFLKFARLSSMKPVPINKDEFQIPGWMTRKPYEPAYPAHRSSRLPSSGRRVIYQKIKSTIDAHDKIILNKDKLNIDQDIQFALLSMLPDISYEYANGHNNQTGIDMTQWIMYAKQYIYHLAKDFNSACNHILYNNSLFSAQVSRSVAFDVVRVAELPEDIVNHIASYFTPETLLAFHFPEIASLPLQLSKLSLDWLKKIKRNCVFNRFTDGLMKKVIRDSQSSNFNGTPEFSKAQHKAMCEYMHKKQSLIPYAAPANKTIAINQIMIVLKMYQNPEDCPTVYLKYKFQEEGLTLLHTLQYIIGRFHAKKLEKRNRSRNVQA